MEEEHRLVPLDFKMFKNSKSGREVYGNSRSVKGTHLIATDADNPQCTCNNH